MEQVLKTITKSTTVRSIVREAGIRHGLAALSRLSPRLAARAGERMFLTPRRFPRPSWEQQALDGAQRSWLFTPQGALPAYSWGTGATVLLVHGWEGRGSQLGAFVPALVAAGYRALAVDMPGHGEAAPALSSAIDFARALQALQPQLGDLHGVIAHSMGGAATALSYALAPLAARAPDGATPLAARAPEGALPLAARAPEGALRHQARVVLLAPPRGPRGFFDMFTRQLELDLPTRAALEQRMQRRFGRSIDDIDIAATGPQVSHETLVIHDRNDKEVPFAHGQLYADTLPNASLIATEGLGHRRILRDAAVIEASIAFLTGGHAQRSNRTEPRSSAGGV